MKITTTVLATAALVLLQMVQMSMAGDHTRPTAAVGTHAPTDAPDKYYVSFDILTAIIVHVMYCSNTLLSIHLRDMATAHQLAVLTINGWMNTAANV